MDRELKLENIPGTTEFVSVARLLLGAALLLIVPHAAAAEWFASVEAGLQHDNNLANAEMAADILGDTALAAAVSAGQAYQLSDSDSLVLQGQLKQQNFNRFHGLNNLTLGASLALKHKWGLGPYAPWLRLSGSIDRLDYRDAARDGWRHAIGMQICQRLSGQWELAAELGFDRRRADHSPALFPPFSGAVFDQDSKTLGLNTSYVASDNLQFSLGYALRRGDLVSTTQSRLRKAFLVSKAIAEDDALGADAYAYRLDGTTGMLQAGALITIEPHLLLSFDYQRLVTHAAGDNNYAKSLSSVTLVYSF